LSVRRAKIESKPKRDLRGGEDEQAKQARTFRCVARCLRDPPRDHAAITKIILGGQGNADDLSAAPLRAAVRRRAAPHRPQAVLPRLSVRIDADRQGWPEHGRDDAITKLRSSPSG
jgi:hypothetical protein